MIDGMLPHASDDLYLTDGGIETVLIFHEGLELPLFAAFTLLEDEAGLATLRRYYTPYVELAADHGLGFVAETPTWRASPRLARELGYADAQLDALNQRAVALMAELRETYPRMVISGCVGPSDDGYNPSTLLTAEEAEAYHAVQVASLAGADMISAITMTYAAEAIGVARAAARVGRPCVISFTVETDGRLPSGQSLADAIAEVDAAADVAYFMVNCAHPTHFVHVFDGPWVDRIRGVRANASALSHAELDEAEELHAGDPLDLAARYATLPLPHLNVVGGCCGTDVGHIAAIAGELKGARSL
jgi:S-methylmethionine-dependent homocysteine/selenocysteine methylase